MCATDKVFLDYTADGTSLGTFTATDALVIIDHREIVFDFYRSVRTRFYTLTAGNTTVCASLSGNSTFVVIRTENRYASSILNKTNDFIGAGSYTYPAADTFLRIDPRHTVFYVDCVLGTDLYTITVSKASEVTVFVTIVVHIGNMAAFFALIVKLA